MLQDKFSNYALSETQKGIFLELIIIISKNILTNLFSGYEKQKEKTTYNS